MLDWNENYTNGEHQPEKIEPFLPHNSLQQGPFVPFVMMAGGNKELAATIVWITKISS